MKRKLSLTRKAKFQILETICFFCLSLLSFLSGYFITHFIFFQDVPLFNEIDWWIVILITLFNTFFILLLDSLFKTSILKRGFFDGMKRSIFTTAIINLLSYFVLSLFDKSVGWYLLLESILFICMLSITRLIIRAIYFRKKRNIGIVGPREQAEQLAKKFFIENKKYRNVAFLFFEEDGLLGDDIYTEIKQCDDIYLTCDLTEYNKSKMIMYCAAKKDIDIHIVPQIYEIGILDSLEGEVDDVVTLEISSFHLTLGQRFIKRFFDIFCSIVGLLIFWPLMLITAIIIKCQDGGSPIFAQERITKDNKPFMLYKFRTMIIDAEKDTGAVLASSNDKRITKFGKIIRATRIDELPQLWNVLKGEMSFIGPRPERRIFVDEFLRETSSYKYRMNVKAGIAGLAQARGNYDTNYRDKLRWDLLYIKKYSLLLDIKIIFWTLKAILDKNSARGVSNDLPIEEFLNHFGKKLEIGPKKAKVIDISIDEIKTKEKISA